MRGETYAGLWDRPVFEPLEPRLLLSAEYWITEIGLPDSLGEATGVSDSGAVCGTAFSPAAFAWASGVTRVLEVGATETVGINNAGQVAGWDAPMGVLWYGGNRVELGTLGGSSSRPADLNEHGHVVGWSRLEDGTTHAFLWRGGQMQDLGVLSGDVESQAWDINDAGQVVGNSDASAFAGQAFLWEDGAMRTLDGLTGNIVVAFAINNSGQVVGARDGTAFVWDEDQGVTDLVGSASALDINDAGVVVGYVGSYGSLRAWVWDSVNGARDLNDLIAPGSGWVLERAYAINEAGWIVGQGRSPDGLDRGFLLTPLPDKPDLVIDERDISMSLTGVGPEQEVVVTVHNQGKADAQNVEVRFFDLDTQQEVDSWVFSSVPAVGSETVSILWTPSVSPAELLVQADPWDQIEEASNDNNSAVAVCDLGQAPVVMEVVSYCDGLADAHTFGRYVADVELLNTFHATVTDPDGAEDVAYVVFDLAGQAEPDYYWEDGWAETFNMGGLADQATLTVTAYDLAGNPSEPWTGTIQVVPFPQWLGTPGSDDRFDSTDRCYHLETFIPEELNISHTIDPEWWIVGGRTSQFRLGATLSVQAGLSPLHDVPVHPEFVFEAVALGEELFGYSKAPFVFEAGPNVTISFDGLADGETLSLRPGLSATLTVTDLSPLEGGEVRLEQGHTVPVPVGPVPIPVRVAIGVNIAMDIDAQLRLGLDLGQQSVELLDQTYLGVHVSGEPFVFGGLGIDGLNIGVELGGELGLNYRVEYNTTEGYRDFHWGTFQINARAVAAIWKRFTLAEWTIPSGEPWTFGELPPMSAGSAASGAGTGPDVYASPVLAADAAGNVLLARVVDTDADPGEVAAEIFYAFRDPAGSWSALGPITNDGLIDGDPAAGFDGAGGAVVTWVHNTIDPAQAESVDYDVYLQTQEIHSSYWNGSSWSAAQAVTADSELDGGPEVAFHNGDGLMLWEHAGGTGSMDLDGFEIHYAVWDEGTHAWGLPAPLTSDAEGDWAPSVAFAPGGEAMAVWVHDDDGDPVTAALHYAFWDGLAWSVPAAVPLLSNEGVRQPEIAFDSDGNALLAWVGNEGEHDILYTAMWNSVASTWSVPQAVPGTSAMIEGLDVAVSSADQAVLVWHGWDGQHDLFATLGSLAGGWSWTPPARVTSDATLDWMTSVALDAAGTPVIVWANDEATTIFGEGADGVELALAPDLAVVGVSLLAPSLMPGQQAWLTAEVANAGWTGAAETTVTFYLGDPGGGGSPLGGTATVPPLAAGQSVQMVGEAFSLPAGTNDYYAVVTAAPGEVELANNSDYVTAESAPTDVTGPKVAADLPVDRVLAGGAGVLALSFDEPVLSVLEPDISLVESTLGCMPPDHVYLSPDGTSATLIFEGGLPPVASADTYTLRVLDSVLDIAGNPLDGDGDASPGGDYQVSFSVFIPGDANGDGSVDGLDYNAWSFHYQQAVPGWREADFNGDGMADGLDYNTWSLHYDESVGADSAAPGAGAGAAGAAGVAAGFKEEAAAALGLGKAQSSRPSLDLTVPAPSAASALRPHGLLGGLGSDLDFPAAWTSAAKGAGGDYSSAGGRLTAAAGTALQTPELDDPVDLLELLDLSALPNAGG